MVDIEQANGRRVVSEEMKSERDEQVLASGKGTYYKDHFSERIVYFRHAEVKARMPCADNSLMWSDLKSNALFWCICLVTGCLHTARHINH